MTASHKLTDTQHKVLEHAIDHADGHVVWFPDGVRGGAQKKVIDCLSNRSLIVNNGTDWLVSAEAYDALGRRQPVLGATAVSPNAVSEEPNVEMIKPPLRSRNNSKQATVIAMLHRLDGATINQICEVTGWQAHYADAQIMPICVGNPASCMAITPTESA